MSAAHIYQIFYDDHSRRSLDPGFLPLDNTDNPRPDWFEFWVIRQYLAANTLNEGEWYGFLSPKFLHKTAIDSRTLHAFVQFSEGKSEVALIPVAWDQLAYFQNPFEQGEVWHPGVTALCQAIAEDLGLSVELRDTVYHSGNFTFCNYLIAKPGYWRRWLALAEQFFTLAEGGPCRYGERLVPQTNHSRQGLNTPMKAFVQERLPFFLILRDGFSTTTLDVSSSCRIEQPILGASARTRGLLHACDQLKHSFLKSNEAEYLEAYRTVRGLIPVQLPAPGTHAARVAQS